MLREIWALDGVRNEGTEFGQISRSLSLSFCVSSMREKTLWQGSKHHMKKEKKNSGKCGLLIWTFRPYYYSKKRKKAIRNVLSTCMRNTHYPLLFAKESEVQVRRRFYTSNFECLRLRSCSAACGRDEEVEEVRALSLGGCRGAELSERKAEILQFSFHSFPETPQINTQ